MLSEAIHTTPIAGPLHCIMTKICDHKAKSEFAIAKQGSLWCLSKEDDICEHPRELKKCILDPLDDGSCFGDDQLLVSAIENEKHHEGGWHCSNWTDIFNVEFNSLEVKTYHDTL